MIHLHFVLYFILTMSNIFLMKRKPIGRESNERRRFWVAELGDWLESCVLLGLAAGAGLPFTGVDGRRIASFLHGPFAFGGKFGLVWLKALKVFDLGQISSTGCLLFGTSKICDVLLLMRRSNRQLFFDL